MRDQLRIFSIEPAAHANNARRHGRVVCQDTTCSVGKILDLSASGMRVRTRHKLPEGAVFIVVLHGLEQPLRVPCRVTWSKRSGLFSREFGIVFHETDGTTRSALTRLARSAAHNEVIRPSIEESRLAG